MEINRQDKELETIEQLEVIESHELKVGNAFHSFKFSSDISEPSESTDSIPKPNLVEEEEQ